MTCRDAMTVDPECCHPDDNVSRAAEIMRDRNVGSVPIVNNLHEKRLVGIVTDRDLAIKLIANHRDPRDARVQDVMSRELVVCRAEDDYETALQSMAERQVRRIPVVDRDGLLIGIIAQADVARRGDLEKAGEVVEEISQPGGVRHQVRRRTRELARRTGVDRLPWKPAAYLGLGAVAMFLAGRRRH